MRKHDSQKTLAMRCLLNTALGGLLCLNLGCNGEMRESVSKYRSEMQNRAEKEDHLVSDEWEDESDTSEEISQEQLAAEQNPPGELKSAEPTAEAEPTASEPAKAEVVESQPTVADASASKSVVNGEVGEKNFEEPSTLDKPKKILPDDSPAWAETGDVYKEDKHTLVFNTSTYATYDESLAKLPDVALEKFAKYSREKLGINIEELKAINREWINKKLIKVDNEFVTEVMDNGFPKYSAWAKLEIDPESTRQELEGMYRRVQWYPRSLRVSGLMLSALAFFGMAHVGFTAISSGKSKKK